MSRYVGWSRTERSERTRIGVTLLLAPGFLLLLPLLVARVGRRLDRRFGLRPPGPAGLAPVLGWPVTVAGFALGIWTILAQLGRGRGTPVPMLPTQALVVDGPFRHCRNPMTLGAILAYLGVAVAARTPSGIAIVAGFGAALVTYLKRLEEPELAERFGDAYLAYRSATPFLVPTLCPLTAPGSRPRPSR